MPRHNQREPIEFRGTGLNRREFFTYATALGVTAGSAMLAGCGQADDDDGGDDDGDGTPTPDRAEATHGGRLVVAIREPFDGVDPATVAPRPDFTAIRKICETLFQTDFEGEIVPHLAKDIEFEDDGLTWIMPLQEDAHFHPPVDRPLEAEDVVASWDRVIAPETGSGRAENFRIVEGWEAIDENTLSVTFDPSPVVGFTGSMEERGGEVMPREELEIGETVTHPVGTGPFVFEEWVEREGITMSRHENYWMDDLPYVDELLIRPITEPSVRAVELRNADIQVDHEPALDEIETYEDDPDVNVNVAATQAGRNNLEVNCAFETSENRPPEPIPILDHDIRVAMQHAIDREAMVNLVYSGFAEPNQTKYPPEYPWCDDYAPFDTGANIQAAQEKIDEAGFDEPEVVIIVRAQNEREVAVGEILDSNLTQAGFEVERQVDEFAVWAENLLAAQYDIRPGVGNVAPDPIIFDRGRYMQRETTEDSKRHYVGGPDNSSEQVVELFDEALMETDFDRRAEMYQEAFNIIVDDGSFVMLCHNDTFTASHSSVNNVRAHPSIMHNNYEEVWFTDPEEFS